jgi:hypothetical protein
MSEEELPPPTEEVIEPAPVHVTTVGVPHIGDASCVVIPSRSLLTTIRTPPVNRSRSNSVDDNQTNPIQNPTTNDLININV